MIKTILILSDGTEIMAGENEVNAIQSVAIEESCNDGEDLNIGSVCAKKISVNIITPKNQLPIKAGEQIILYEEENDIRRKKGVFNAEKPQKKNSNTTKLEAYDNISLLDKDVTEWFNTLDRFPYTAFNMAKMTCEYCGVGFSNSSIMNGDFPINKTELESVTGRQIIRWIGEICGCFCVANEDGDILYRWYEEKDVPIVANRKENGVVFLQGSLSYEDYETKKIDRVQIREEKNSVGIVYPNGSYGENSYIIESNPFLIEDARTEDIAESLYNILRNISYVPCKVSVPYSFKFNVGDIIKIKDANGVEFRSYIMQKHKTGQKETLECTGNYERNGATTLYSTSYTAGYGEKLKIHKDIAKIELETSENGSKIGLIVETSDEGENSIRGSILLQAINDDGSEAQIRADKVNLEGYVTVSSLGKDGTTIIDGSRIQTGRIQSQYYVPDETGMMIDLDDWGIIDAPNFKVDNDYVFINGIIEAKAGNIGGWKIVNDDTEHNLHYFDDDLKLGTGFQPPNSGVWSISIGFSNYEDWSDGSFRVRHDGIMFANRAVLSNVTFDTGDFTTSINDSGINFLLDDAYFGGINVTEINNSLNISAPNITIGVLNTDSAVHLNHLNGTWYIQQSLSSSPTIVISDINKKNSIEFLDSRYDVFFDNLIMRRFKYNDGTSDRYHTGYVAQEIQSALKTASIGEQEFAGICTIKDDDGEYSGLRYNEFVSLNTWQIQKLKARVTELENKLDAYELY